MSNCARAFLIAGLALTVLGAAILSYRDLRPKKVPTRDFNDLALGFPRPEAWLGFPLIALGSILQVIGILLD